MNFFQTLLRPDREDDPDRGQVIHAANLLQVGEFQLLQLAFAEWHGREMTPEEQSVHFDAFFLHGQTPSYLRHYARRIIAEEAAGTLQASASQFHRYDNDYFRSRLPDGMRKFLVAMTLVVGFVGGSIAMASYTVKQTGACIDTTPPCFTKADLRSPQTPPDVGTD